MEYDTATLTRPSWHVFTARHNTHPFPSIWSRGATQHDVTRSAASPLGSPDGEVAALSPGRGWQLFADLTSPWALLARLRFGAAVTSPPWAAIARPTTIPLTGQRGPSPERERLSEELAAVRSAARNGEHLPQDVPTLLPHPRPVAAAYAEAVDLGRGPEVLDVLLQAYWFQGQDIGSPEVLRRILPPVIVGADTLCTGDPRREFGYLVSPAREPLTNQAFHQLQRWQERWSALGCPGPLALVEASGTVHAGPAALAMPAARRNT